MVEIKNLCRTFLEGKPSEVVALRNINLSVKDGEMISIMGPSGSGKSTLLHILALLDDHYTGEYIFDGQDVHKLKDSRKALIRNHGISLIMQDYGLIGELSALSNVELPLIIAGESGKKLHKKALVALREVGMEQKAKYNTNLLSGGERQRVAIARAIVSGAKLILADEPTGAVDSKTTVEIINLMKKLNSTGVTVIIVTHDVVVAKMCNRQINIVDGSISQC